MHTPGPWRVFDPRVETASCIEILCGDRLAPITKPSDGIRVAKVTFKRVGRGGRFLRSHVDEANARLICAAPELLAELRTSPCPGGGWTGMPDRLEGIATVQDCLDAGVCGCSCGAAVKKAEGK